MYGIVSRFAVSITDHLAEDRCAWQFEITSWGQSLRHHGMQRHSPDSQHVQESCESLTGALLSNQWTARLPIPSWLWLRANCSCREWKRKLDADGLGLTILKPICDNTKGQYFGLRHRIGRRTSICKDPRQLRNLGDPTSVDFLFTFQREIHVFIPTLSTLAKTLVFAHPSLSATIQAPFPEIRLTAWIDRAKPRSIRCWTSPAPLGPFKTGERSSLF